MSENIEPEATREGHHPERAVEENTLDDIREAWIARYWDDFALFDIDETMREEEGAEFDKILNHHLALAWGKAANSIVQAFVNNPDQPLPANPYVDGDWKTMEEHQ